MITLTIDLTEDEALALAQLCKRVGFSDLRECASDDNEAYQMQQAMTVLRSALADKGVAPR